MDENIAKAIEQTLLLRQEGEERPAEPVFTPAAIYFDTEPLNASGWPKPSTQLSEVMRQADELGFTICLPEAVQQELEGQWARDIFEAWKKANSHIDTLNKRAVGLVEISRLSSLPQKQDLTKQLRESIGAFTKRFISVPFTTRPISDFVSLAINRGATFDEKGRGFRDAVILCSVLDHMKLKGFKAGALVSKDDDFQRDGVARLAEEAGVTLKVLRTLDDLQQLITQHYSARVLDAMKAERAQLIDAVRARISDLQAFIETNLEIEPGEIKTDGMVDRIRSVRVVSLENAHTAPWSWWGNKSEDANKVRVSIETKVTLTLEVERYPAGEPVKLKAGAAWHLRAANIIDPLVLGLGELEEEECEVLVVVEGEAVRGQSSFSNVEFKSVRLKSEDRGLGFGALLALRG